MRRRKEKLTKEKAMEHGWKRDLPFKALIQQRCQKDDGRQQRDLLSPTAHLYCGCTTDIDI